MPGVVAPALFDLVWWWISISIYQCTPPSMAGSSMQVAAAKSFHRRVIHIAPGPVFSLANLAFVTGAPSSCCFHCRHFCTHLVPQLSYTRCHCAHPADVVRELAAAFHVREDLRSTISGVLVKLCKQARSVALAALNPEAGTHLNLHQLNLRDQQGLTAAAGSAGTDGVAAETLDAIRALGLVSAAAAAVPSAEVQADDVQDNKAAGDDSDDFEAYGAAEPSGRGRRARQQQQDGSTDGLGQAPARFTADVALRQLQALRGFSNQWMTLLCRIYIDVSELVMATETCRCIIVYL